MVVPQKQRESSGSAEFVFYVPEFVLPDVSTVLRRAASADTGFICSVIAGYSFDFTSVLYFLTSITGRYKNHSIRRHIHYAPTVFFFWMLMPFWFEPASVQYDFTSGNLHDVSNLPLLAFIRNVYRIGVYTVIHAQFVVYFILILIELRRCRRQIENRYSFNEQMNLSGITYFVLFFILLYILIIFSHFLGVSIYPVSRIIFNIVSSGIIFFLIIRGLKFRKMTNVEDAEKDGV